MIDIENAVFDKVRTAIRESFLSEYPDLTILNERPEVQEKFPCVVITQDDNSTYNRGRTVEGKDRYAEVMFTIDVYTAVVSGGKTLAKKIASVADEEMLSLFFSRMFFRETPNIDRKLKRITARYRAVVGKATVTKDSINYPIYRR